MAGSTVVNANLGIVHKGMLKAFEAAMDRHIKQSATFIKGNHRWDDKTGAATSAVQSKTTPKTGSIISTVYGKIETNLYLDQAWFFQGRYQIFERARSNNIYILWAAIRAICKGSGYGFKFGGLG